MMLRRWPREEDRPISEGIEGPLEDWFSGGVPTVVKTARIKIGGVEELAEVTGDERFIPFHAPLERGLVQLQT